MARPKWKDEFEDGCFCLITLVSKNSCEATIYVHMLNGRAWHVFDHCEFKSSGEAIEWAYAIQTGIKIIKVIHYEWD